MNVFQQRLLAVAAATLLAGAAHAGTVATRADLQSAIGGVGSLETFGSLSVSGGGATTFGCASNTMSAGASCGQSTTALTPGASYTSGEFQLNGAGYFGAPSNELLSDSGALGVGFTGTVNAIGLDLRAYTGYGATATVTVYGKDGVTVLDTSSVALGSGGAPVFFGYESSADIGSLSLTQSTWGWSPIIDNVEWGATASAVPEPTSFLLMGLSLGMFAIARRKRA